MAITLLQEADANDNTSPFSVAGITISAGTNRLMLVALCNYGANAATTVTAATFGGVSLHEIGTHNTAGANPNPCIYFGYLLDSEIPSGSQTLAATWSAGTLKGGHVWVFEGVDQTTPYEGFNGASDLSSPVDPAALSMGTVAAGDAVVCVGSVNSSVASSVPSTYTASTSANWGNTTGNNTGAHKLVGSTGVESPDFDFSATSGSRSAQAGLVLLQAGGASGPIISDGTPTGTVSGSFTAGFTTDTASGTARIVIDSAANLSGVTATQILAGQKANGTAAAYDSGNITVTDTSPDYAFSGVATATYTVAAAHSDGVDNSNVLTWTLTVDATAPSFSASPSVSAIAATTATIAGTSNETGTVSVVATSAAAGQPSDGTFDASSFTDAITAATPFSIPITGLTALSLYKFWVQIKDAVGNRTTSSVLDLTSPTGYSRVTIGTPNTTADNRLTATADIASGDVVAWGDVVGTGSVIVYDDAAFEADEGVTAFDFYVGNTTDGWGASETQTVGGADEIAPSVTSLVISSLGQALGIYTDESVDFGAGGNAGVTLSMSGGAVTATYSSGAGTGLLVYSLSRIIVAGETGTVTYVQPTNGIQDIAGNDLASFGPTVVTNNSTYDGSPATINSAVVVASGDQVWFLSDEALSIGAGGNTGFTVSMSGGACTLTYVSGAGTGVLIYSTSRTIKGAETGTAAYTQPGNGIEDAWGADVVTFSGLAVSNQSTVNTAPTDISLSSSAVATTAGVNAVVGVLSTTDADVENSFTYTLVAGTGDTDNASFSISGANLRCDDPSVLGVGEYSVRVQSSDGTDTVQKAFTITVLEPSESVGPVTRSITRGVIMSITRSITG